MTRRRSLSKGFGVVSLKSEGATGSVAPIGDMGAKADISDSDLTLHYKALPNFSFSPGLVLNLGDPGEVLAYGTAKLAGLTVDYDLLLDVQPLHESDPEWASVGLGCWVQH